MTAATISVNDRNSNEVKLATDFQGDKHVPVHQQDPAQHQAVLDGLDAVAEAVGGIGGASDPATGTAQAGTNSRLDSLVTLVGQVQATPTTNTLLGRLKAIADALTGTLTVGTHAVTQAGSWVISAGSAVIGKVGIDSAANTVVLGSGTAIAGKVGIDSAANTVTLAAGTAIAGKVGIDTAANAVVAAPSVDQDPIFDHTNGTKTTVTTSATVLTPPAGCKYARIATDVDCFIRTDGSAAADAAGSIRLIANQPETIPVVAAVAVTAYAASSAVVRVTPLKVR